MNAGVFTGEFCLQLLMNKPKRQPCIQRCICTGKRDIGHLEKKPD